MRGRVHVIVYTLVFTLGLAAGAMGLRLYERSYGASAEGRGGRFDRERYVSLLTRDVQLTSDQRKELDRIMDDTRGEFAEVRKTIAPQVTEIKERARGRIRAMLTPDQQPRFEAFLKAWDAEREQRGER
ncbi:MAG: hypothetical protein ACREJP_04850 [Candidatus Methylomirabilales bacterium]